MGNKKRKKHIAKNQQKRKVKAVEAQYILPPVDLKTHIPEVNEDAWLRGILNRDPAVFDAIIKYAVYFEDHHYKQYGSQAVLALDKYVRLTFLALLTSELVPTPNQACGLIQTSHLFKNLCAVSNYGTTDSALRSVLHMEKNLPKVLFLQNSRTEFQLNQSQLFDKDPILASLWYRTYLLGNSTPTAIEQTNMFRHLEDMDERWQPYMHPVTGTYFTSTYHNPDAARRCKGIMNRAMKKKIPHTFTNKPNPKKIAIITNKWHRNHAVYKSAGPLVEQLVGKYELDLIWTGSGNSEGKVPDNIVSDYFENIYHCYFSDDGSMFIPNELRNNDYAMIYFPDIGMTDESIWLSNCRMAPIQAMGYGHPETSGDDSEIDYFIGGDIEAEVTDRYSETMVLIPGLAQHPAWPTAERKNNWEPSEKVRINCVLGPDKYNYTWLTMLAAINEGVGSLDTHEFHFFCSPGVNRYASLPVFINDIKRTVPNAIIHSEQEYYAYMENAEQHDFSINSFPFGGYNTLVESLYLGLPFVTLVGERFYNRAGEYLNSLVGLDELSSKVPREVVNICIKLIKEPEYLKEKREHLASIDLKETLFCDSGEHFLEAVQHILSNHPFNETKRIGNNDE